jgi:hypothetical protein
LYRANSSRARLEIDDATKIVRALCLGFIKDSHGVVIERWRAEQNLPDVRRRAGQPPVLSYIHDDGHILPMPGDDLRAFACDCADHFAKSLFGFLYLPMSTTR